MGRRRGDEQETVDPSRKLISDDSASDESDWENMSLAFASATIVNNIILRFLCLTFIFCII